MAWHERGLAKRMPTKLGSLRPSSALAKASSRRTPTSCDTYMQTPARCYGVGTHTGGSAALRMAGSADAQHSKAASPAVRLLGRGDMHPCPYMLIHDMIHETDVLMSPSSFRRRKPHPVPQSLGSFSKWPQSGGAHLYTPGTTNSTPPTSPAAEAS
ncbi:hypothetical protein CCMA1212_010265 [Trichoderma ghanense]|uniref:Uncharacterized protein n=1 Tax=Trichoderma ghanense TaxID=65468 RepID=A0ABY2GR64_9HYPO